MSQGLPELPTFAGPEAFLASYEAFAGPFMLRPGLKSEYFRQSPFLQEDEDNEHWSGIAQVLVDLPVTANTRIQSGLELLRFHDLVLDEDDLLNRGVTGETGDLTSTQVAVQFSVTSGYLGYLLTTQVGLRVGRIRAERINEVTSEDLQSLVYEKRTKSRSEATSFITVYAGVE